MSSEWIIALCALGGALGGSLGAWITLRVSVAVQGNDIASLKKEVESLRHDRHVHGQFIHEHEMRLSMLERKNDT